MTLVSAIGVLGMVTASRDRVTAAPAGVCSGPDLVVPVPASFTFGVIGDYGSGSAARRVSTEMKRWNPTYVATVGDNAYDGDAPLDAAGNFVWSGSTIDRSIGQWFWAFIGNYRGAYGSGPAPARPSRFFPALGNHDWDGSPADGVWSKLPYRSYFTLPGNERYYSVRTGPVQLFVLDSEPRSPGTGAQYETDGVDADSVQGRWLRDQLADSTARFKIVVMHHPPYTSASRGGTAILRWPFAQWGASMVLAGHEHQYERLVVPGGVPLIVTGHGGQSLTGTFPKDPSPATSVVRVGDRYGALRIDVTPSGATVRMYSQPETDPTAPFTVLDQFTVPTAPTMPVNPSCDVDVPGYGPLAPSAPTGGAVANATATRIGVSGG